MRVRQKNIKNKLLKNHNGNYYIKIKFNKKDKKFHRVERFYGSFMRSFTLPDNVDESEIEASFKDGMLNLTIPKTKATKPKAIDVKIK